MILYKYARLSIGIVTAQIICVLCFLHLTHDLTRDNCTTSRKNRSSALFGNEAQTHLPQRVGQVVRKAPTRSSSSTSFSVGADSGDT